MNDNPKNNREKTLNDKKRISRRELLSRISPLGVVSICEADCTGCGICAQVCPTGALTVAADGETGVFRLLFRHGLCIACGDCVRICPEKCLSLERKVEPGKIDGETVLFEDEILRCPRCGSPVGPAGMIKKLRDRMGVMDPEMISRVELCPRCKVQSEFSHLLGKDGHIS